LISLVSYSTFRRWIREAEAAHVARQPPPQPTGRPRTASDIRELVLKLATENSWGYTRILGELRKLGIESISRSTVKAILKEHHIAPAPDRPRGSWSEFIRIHAATLVQCDFLSKPVWTPKGLVTLYVLAFIHIGSRRLWLSPSTRAPDAAWVTQQAERFMDHASAEGFFLPSPSGRGAGGEGLPPAGFLLRDNDVKYPPAFDEVFRKADIKVPKMPPRAPNMRAHVERVIQTIQNEVLNSLIVTGEHHFNHILRESQNWYNAERPHSKRDHLPPGWDKPPNANNTATSSEIVCTTRLGGLLNSYSRRAA
jgi:putative transposase